MRSLGFSLSRPVIQKISIVQSFPWISFSKPPFSSWQFLIALRGPSLCSPTGDPEQTERDRWRLRLRALGRLRRPQTFDLPSRHVLESRATSVSLKNCFTDNLQIHAASRLYSFSKISASISTEDCSHLKIRNLTGIWRIIHLMNAYHD